MNTITFKNKMNNTVFHKQIFINSTILFLLGLFLAIQPDFKKLYILEYKEIYVIIFGYLPTWGLVFSLSSKNLVRKNRISFVVYTISLYCLLHYFSLRIGRAELTFILTAFGAFITLIILKFSERGIVIKFLDYSIITTIGGLTFLPWTL